MQVFFSVLPVFLWKLVHQLHHPRPEGDRQLQAGVFAVYNKIVKRVCPTAARCCTNKPPIRGIAALHPDQSSCSGLAVDLLSAKSVLAAGRFKNFCISNASAFCVFALGAQRGYLRVPKCSLLEGSTRRVWQDVHVVRNYSFAGVPTSSSAPAFSKKCAFLLCLHKWHTTVHIDGCFGKLRR